MRSRPPRQVGGPVGTAAHYMVGHGDRVMAFVDFDRGAQSEYVVVKAVELVQVPGDVNLAHAAAAGLASMTAWQGLFDHGGLAGGQRVLIHGGAGGVGHLAVQLAKWRGATVYATAGARDLDFVRSLGADVAIDYAAERFEAVARDLDLVFDTQGGETQARSWATLRKGGCLVSTLETDEAAAKAHGVRTVPRWHAEPNAEKLGQVSELLATRAIRVEVARSFPFDEVREAYRFTRDEHPRGKVVLRID